jgi:hypothetical protein
MQFVIYYVTWAIFLGAIVAFGWAAIFRSDFRKDVFGGSQGEAKVLGLVTVKGAAIILIFGLLLGGILQVFNIIGKIDERQFASNINELRSSLEDATKGLMAAQAVNKRLVFRPLDEASPPYCDPRDISHPQAVPTHDPSGRPNLALLAEAEASASSLISWTDVVTSRHAISYLNDGWYSNCRSWVADRLPAWAKLNLGKQYQVTGVAFGSDQTGRYKDRAALAFKIETSENNTDWKLICNQDRGDPVQVRQLYNFGRTVQAQYVRLTIYTSTPPVGFDSTDGNGLAVRVDEFEVFGESETSPAPGKPAVFAPSPACSR